jgi:hypothetical protein
MPCGHWGRGNKINFPFFTKSLFSNRNVRTPPTCAMTRDVWTALGFSSSNNLDVPCDAKEEVYFRKYNLPRRHPHTAWPHFHHVLEGRLTHGLLECLRYELEENRKEITL